MRSSASERTNFRCVRSPQIRMREVNELAVEPLAGDLPHVELRMGEQQTQQFAAGVAGRADDGGGETLGHVTSYTRRAFGQRDCRDVRHDPRRPAIRGIPPSVATCRQKSTIRSGMFTPVGAMLLRNSIV